MTVTLLVATQRPTQKAMGSGAVRSQMDVRVCLRMRERRDVDLVLGQGMLAAGWHAHTLDAPGKLLVSTPEHTTPRRARAYLLTDTDVTTLATRHAPTRPTLNDVSRAIIDTSPGADDQPRAVPRPRHSNETLAEPGPTEGQDPDTALLSALRQAPPEGSSVPDLMTATGMRPHLGLRPTAPPRHRRASRPGLSRPLARRQPPRTMTRSSAPRTRLHA